MPKIYLEKTLLQDMRNTLLEVMGNQGIQKEEAQRKGVASLIYILSEILDEEDNGHSNTKQ